LLRGSLTKVSPTSVTPRTWVRRALVALIIVAIGYTVMDLVEQVDWSAVWHEMGRVTWPQVAVLFLLLVVKQTLNASPLSFFLPGLSLFRATVNDQASTLLQMMAPPPSDLMLRLRIFSSWGIDRTRGLAGSMMNVLSYYTNRLLVPTLGLVMLATVGSPEVRDVLVATVSLAAGVVLVVLLRMAVRDPSAAERIGTGAGRSVQRFRSSVEPAAWGARTLDFRGHIADRFPYAFPRSLGMLVAMTLVDASTVLLSLRFVGVPASALPALVVIGGFLLWYPLTVLPLSGLGVLDAVLVAMFTVTAGEVFEAEIVAALIVYRLVSIGGTVLLGALAVVYWRLTTRDAEESAVA
jgi:uncharacterized membrane protein YbhN (UPF0104 family)